MRRKVFILLAVSITLILLVSCGKKDEGPDAVGVLTGLEAAKQKIEIVDPQLAVIKARSLYRKKLLEGEDMSGGLCLSEELVVNWCAAINDAEKCAKYRSNEVKHCVILDAQGNLISAL